MRRALLLLPILTGCAAPPRIVQMVCPTLPSKAVTPHPDPLPPISNRAQVMQPGHWNWVDGNYVWEGPAWVLPPHLPPVIWTDGFWTPNGGGCAWTPGHFLP